MPSIDRCFPGFLRFTMAGLLAAAALAACGETGPTEFLAVHLDVDDGFPLPDSLEQATPSDPVDVVVRIANYGAEQISIDGTCGAPFRIMDVRKVVVGPELVPCDNAPPPIPIPQGEIITFTSQWGGEDLNGELLPIGTYAFVAWTSRADRDYAIETNVMWVRLKEDGTRPIPSRGDILRGSGSGADSGFRQLR